MDLLPAILCSLDLESQWQISKSYSVHTTYEGGRQVPQTAASGHARRGLHRGSSGVQTRVGVRSYRPKHTFPAAVDDIDDVVGYLFKNAEVKFGANPELFTVGGSSAGGNLALAACQQPACQYPSKTAVGASVTFYAPVGIVP